MDTEKKLDKPLNVLIVSASIGTGHIQAAFAIEEYWRKMHPNATIQHIDFLDTDTLSLDNILKETYIKMIDVFPMMYDLVYRLSQGEHKGGLGQTVLSWLMKSRMLKLIKRKQPDVLVFTHPFPCGAACILKRQKLIDTPIVAVITDFAIHQFWIYKQVDAYYVPTETLVGELKAAHIPAEKVHVSGIPVRSAFFKDRKEEYSVTRPVKILIMGGGLGLGSLANSLKRLDEVRGVDEFIVVAGRNTALYESLMDMKDTMTTPTTVYGYTSNIAELMKECTLLVTKPGALTCMEAVTVGIPMVFFNAIPGQEEANARLLEKRGYGRWARDIHNLEDVVTALLIDPPRLYQMWKAEREWDINGSETIVNSIYKNLFEKK